MSEIGSTGVELHPSSSWKIAKKDKSHKQSVDKEIKLASKIKTKSEKGLEKLSIKDERYTKIVSEAKKDLIDLYASAGVEIKEDDFPRTFLISNDNKEKTGKHWGNILNEDITGSYGGKALAAVVFVPDVSPASLVVSADSTHHELHHSIGRRVVIPSISRGWTLAQIGHATRAKSPRGFVLEEGMMTFYGYKFQLESKTEEMVNLRSQVTITKNDNLTRSAYVASRKLVEDLFHQAVRVGGIEKRQELEKAMLRSRVHPKERTKLINVIKSIYGENSDIPKQIYGCQMNWPEISKVRNSMNAKTAKSVSQN